MGILLLLIIITKSHSLNNLKGFCCPINIYYLKHNDLTEKSIWIIIQKKKKKHNKQK